MHSLDGGYVLYASTHREPDIHRRMYAPVFREAHTARQWLERMINGKPFIRQGNLIVVDTHPGYTTSITVTIRSDQLDAILAAPKANEDLPEDIARSILRFKYGTWEEIHTPEPTAEVETEVIERTKRPAVPDGYVTVTSLCQGSSVLPMNARALLRANNYVKPEYGWAFSPADLPKIKKLIGV